MRRDCRRRLQCGDPFRLGLRSELRTISSTCFDVRPTLADWIEHIIIGPMWICFGAWSKTISNLSKILSSGFPRNPGLDLSSQIERVADLRYPFFPACPRHRPEARRRVQEQEHRRGRLPRY